MWSANTHLQFFSDPPTSPGASAASEFLQVVAHAADEHMPVIVERVRSKLAARTFSFGGSSVSVTASFGVAGFRGGDTAPAFSDLVSRADRALYRAKQLGRNRAEFEPLSPL